MTILENIDIDIDKAILKKISISIRTFLKAVIAIRTFLKTSISIRGAFKEKSENVGHLAQPAEPPLLGHFLGYPPKMHNSALQCSAMY